MKQIQFVVIAAIALLTGCNIGANEDFYAYHTRLDYTIPIEDLAATVPGFNWEEEENDELKAIRAYYREQERLQAEGEDEEEDRQERRRRRRRDFTGQPISGKFADLIVNLAPGRQLVFSRQWSYQPVWKTENEEWPIGDIVERQNDPACLYSYARLIENQPGRIVVHWRYIPDLKNPNGLKNTVHEYFDISPDGTVVRRIRHPKDNLDDFKDPGNVTVQTLRLKKDGVEQVALIPAQLTKHSQPSISGASIKEQPEPSPVVWFKFDEGLKERSYDKRDLTLESISDAECHVNGNVTLWKRGVSGTALAFDGYDSKVTLPASKVPKIEDEVTLEAWVVLGAYPWNWAPLIHQSIMDPGPIEKGTYDELGRSIPRKKGSGYYLGVDPYGYPIFIVDEIGVKGTQKLTTYSWKHLAGTYGDGKMVIYVDGKEAGSVRASGKIDIPATDLLIGLNNVTGRATDPVRAPTCHMDNIYGIEGLIDEVKIYTSALDASQISTIYSAFEADVAEKDHPDLEPRILPGNTGMADAFGARYADLQYHELWNNLWRSCGDQDVLVKFDDSPVSFAFWRGVNGGVGWITENNKWMSDQSVELGGPHGCSEHMADKQCRHAYVRIIENTPARAVIHWRYASIDVGYVFPNARYWTDEYYHIYPDGTGLRKVYFYNGNAGWHDVQFLNQPGTSPLDNVNLQAVTVANMDGEIHEMTWSGSNGVPRNQLGNANISMINFKSEYKVFLVYPEGARIGTWGSREQSPHTDDPFAGPWNHWPVSMIPSDGRYAVANDRLTHAAFGGAGNVVRLGNMIIYGLTNKPITELLPLARSWNYPPQVTKTQNCDTLGYAKEQRAYQFKKTGEMIAFMLDASKTSPVYNPCFMIKNWDNRSTKAALKINGDEQIPGADFRQGIVTDTDGKPMMVVWVRFESDRTTNFEIAKE